MLELTIRLIVSLAIVVGLLLLLARLSSRRFGSQKGALVQVVHRQPLSRTSAVSVVSVGSRVLVLGTTEHKVNVLAELDPADLEAEQATEEATVLELVGAPVAELPVEPVALTGLPAELPTDWDTLAPAEVAALLGEPEEPAADVRRPRPPGHRRATKSAAPAHSAKATHSAKAAKPGRRAARPAAPSKPAAKPATGPGTGALAGSVLSPQTWRQAIAAVTRRAS